MQVIIYLLRLLNTDRKGSLIGSGVTANHVHDLAGHTISHNESDAYLRSYESSSQGLSRELLTYTLSLDSEH